MTHIPEQDEPIGEYIKACTACKQVMRELADGTFICTEENCGRRGYKIEQ